MVSLSSHGLLVPSLGAERVVVEVNVSNLQEGNEGFMLFVLIACRRSVQGRTCLLSRAKEAIDLKVSSFP